MQIIWNSLTRAELLKFVDQQRASQGPDGSYDLTESRSFTYQALSKELHVGYVYLRVYNNQPDYEISEPEAFCTALLKFISGIVHHLKDANMRNRFDNNGSPEEPSEVQDGNLSGPHNEGKSSTEESEEITEESAVVKNLHMGLTSLQVLSFLVNLSWFVVLSNIFYFYYFKMAESLNQQPGSGCCILY